MTNPAPALTAASLSVADRLALIQRVFAHAFEETESWNDDHLGTFLAYLALAIADGAADSFVDWTDANGNRDTKTVRELFRNWFPVSDLCASIKSE